MRQTENIISNNNSNKVAKQKNSKGCKRWDGMMGWTIWVFLLICFEKDFGRNCFQQSNFGEQWIPLWFQGKIYYFSHLTLSRKRWGLGVNEILNELWKEQNVEITLFCAKFRLVSSFMPRFFLKRKNFKTEFYPLTKRWSLTQW